MRRDPIRCCGTFGAQPTCRSDQSLPARAAHLTSRIRPPCRWFQRVQDGDIKSPACLQRHLNSVAPSLLRPCAPLQARLREQARRGYQWLVEQDRQSVVQRALRPFLAESSIWARLTANDHHRHAHVLQNEGAALLEGGVYGGEVIMACHAATACGADIVLADRDKALSNARLLAARRAERLHRLQRMPDGACTAHAGTHCITARRRKVSGTLSGRSAVQTIGRWLGLRPAWQRPASRTTCTRSWPLSPPRTRRRSQSTCTPSSWWLRCPRTSACSRRWDASRGAWWPRCGGCCAAAAARTARCA